MITVTAINLNTDLAKFEGEYHTFKDLRETLELERKDFRVCVFQTTKSAMLDDEFYIAEDQEVGEWVEDEDALDYNLLKEFEEKYHFLGMF